MLLEQVQPARPDRRVHRGRRGGRLHHGQRGAREGPAAVALDLRRAAARAPGASIPSRPSGTTTPSTRRSASSARPSTRQKLTALISEICLDAYNIVDCHDYARIEVRVDRFGNPYILEINPNPSINTGDCVPNCAEMTGLKYEDFIEEILKRGHPRATARGRRTTTCRARWPPFSPKHPWALS